MGEAAVAGPAVVAWLTQRVALQLLRAKRGSREPRWQWLVKLPLDLAELQQPSSPRWPPLLAVYGVLSSKAAPSALRWQPHCTTSTPKGMNIPQWRRCLLLLDLLLRVQSAR